MVMKRRKGFQYTNLLIKVLQDYVDLLHLPSQDTRGPRLIIRNIKKGDQQLDIIQEVIKNIRNSYPIDDNDDSADVTDLTSPDFVDLTKDDAAAAATAAASYVTDLTKDDAAAAALDVTDLTSPGFFDLTEDDGVEEQKGPAGHGIKKHTRHKGKHHKKKHTRRKDKHHKGTRDKGKHPKSKHHKGTHRRNKRKNKK